ncbi:MAG: hypothetical protein JO000_19410 [Alphaproteobacteria bacterium]|nr:hypothetical protein [Alphaproteobacteria bacterium]
MYLSLAIGAVIASLRFSMYAAQVGASPLIAMQAVMFASFALFIWLIARRHKNWGRWVFLVMYVLGLPILVLNELELAPTSPIAATLVFLQCFVQAYALFLIFTGDAKSWFTAASPTSAA